MRMQFIATLTLALSMAHFSLSATIVEWAPYKKHKTTELQELIYAADLVNKQFLSQQPGFIKRELVRKSENEFADILHWESLDDAHKAAMKVESCHVCLEYFGLMDQKESKKSGAGFSYYETIKSW